MQRAPWIIGGSIVLAAAILATALLVSSFDSAPNDQRSGAQEILSLGAQRLAQDRDAQSALRNALVAAKTHYTDASTYGGFDPEVGAAIEPSLAWYPDIPAVPGAISINLATDDDVVLSTRSETGQVFCIAERDEGPSQGTYYGRVDGSGATDAMSCEGGW
jgi:outer membrane murein-binding lipoprotein Lpp